MDSQPTHICVIEENKHWRLCFVNMVDKLFYYIDPFIAKSTEISAKFKIWKTLVLRLLERIIVNLFIFFIFFIFFISFILFFYVFMFVFFSFTLVFYFVLSFLIKNKWFSLLFHSKVIKTIGFY